MQTGQTRRAQGHLPTPQHLHHGRPAPQHRKPPVRLHQRAGSERAGKCPAATTANKLYANSTPRIADTLEMDRGDCARDIWQDVRAGEEEYGPDLPTGHGVSVSDPGV